MRRMRLFGIAMVRNEADVIEAFVRHNLSILDGLYVIHHRPVDGTDEILRALAAEGLALKLRSRTELEYEQTPVYSALAREVIAGEDADFVFGLDADEFLRIPSRAKLEEALVRVPPGVHCALRWETYVPLEPAAGPSVVSTAAVRRRVRDERYPVFKVAVSRHFLERRTEMLFRGSHMVVDSTKPKPPQHARLNPGIAAIAHLPVRSAAQLATKAVCGCLAQMVTHPHLGVVSAHWKAYYDEVRAGRPLDAKRIMEVAVNYGLPREKWQPVGEVALEDDPPLPEVPLRYAAMATLDPLAVVTRFSEDLIGVLRPAIAETPAAATPETAGAGPIVPGPAPGT